MAVPYHTHNFELPAATKQEVAVGIAMDKVVVPASLGSAAAEDVAAFATAVQGEKADLAVASKRKLIAGDGLEGGGDLSEDRVISLSRTTLIALDNAASKTVSIIPGDGLTGGGSLSDSTIELSLNTISLDAISKAQSAVQLADLGGLAKKNKIAITDISATGSASQSNFLRGDGRWITISASDSDMQRSVYDPNNIAKNIYNSDNITEGNAHKFVTATEKSQIAKINDLSNSDNITQGKKHLFLTVDERDSIKLIAHQSAMIEEIFRMIDGERKPLIGQIAFFPCDEAPDGWVKANGAVLSAGAYLDLWEFAKYHATFISDESWAQGMQGCFSFVDDDHFRVPDLRGEFLRGWDDGRGVDADRMFGTFQEDAIRNITGNFYSRGKVQFGDGTLSNGAFSKFETTATGNVVAMSSTILPAHGTNFSAARMVPTASENRPRNIALLACIKY